MSGPEPGQCCQSPLVLSRRTSGSTFRTQAARRIRRDQSFAAPFSPKCCIDAFQIIPAFGVFSSILKIRAVRVGKPWGGLTEISPLTMAVSENNNWLVFLRSSGPLPTSAVCLPYLLQGVFPQSLPFLQSHCLGKRRRGSKLAESVWRCACEHRRCQQRGLSSALLILGHLANT